MAVAESASICMAVLSGSTEVDAVSVVGWLQELTTIAIATAMKV